MIWWGLGRAERRPDWLGVEAPRRALAGQPFPVRVRLAPLAEPGFLCADLHWGATRDTSMSYLASGGSKAVGKEGGTLDFDIAVPPKEGMRFVMGVIYFGRTGSWDDHKLSATTELIPVVSGQATPEEARLEPLRTAAARASHRQAIHAPAYGPRLLTSLLFLAAMMAAWVHRLADQSARWQAKSGNPMAAGAGRFAGFGVLVGTVRAGELAGRSGAGNGAREGSLLSADGASEGRDQYGGRGERSLLPFIRRARSSHRLVLVSFALYLAISVVNLVSLHAIDKVADLSWHGVSLVQALKLGCAVMTLEGVRRMRRTG